MPKYNGHKNWNHWNVSLWINNDESLYKWALACIRCTANKDAAAHRFLKEFAGEKTPDGAPYTFTTVRAALVGMEK